MDFWKSFQSDAVEDEPAAASPILADVLSTFGIPNGGVTSGSLQNVNLKRVSPISAIKASLLELMATTKKPVEFCANAEGKVITYEVGGSGSLSSTDVYYTVPSQGYVPTKVGVMITGGKPLIKRIVFPWYNLIGGGGSNYTIWDSTHMESNCLLSGFTTVATVTYNDPILTTGQSSYANGIAEIFEVANPFQNIVGYAWKIDPGWKSGAEPLVTVLQQGHSSVPMLLGSDGMGLLPEQSSPGYSYGGNSPNIGVPRRRGTKETDTDCFILEDGSASGGTPLIVGIPVKEGLTYTKYGSTVVNKFMGISGVYFVGIALTSCAGYRKIGGLITDTSAENTSVVLSSENATEGVFALSESEEYTINYSSFGSFVNSDRIELQFANNSRYTDNGVFGTNVPFYIDHNSIDLYKLYAGSLPESSNHLTGKGTILPTKSMGGGILVKQVWTKVDLDCPSFVIKDPGGKAAEKAKELVVDITAIALEELPAPIAINGVLINQEDGFKDNDPTTTQDFEDTELAINMKKLDSGRTMSLSLGSLNDVQTTALSKNLYDLMKRDVGKTYVHTCAPTATPVLGTNGIRGGVINSITYSYQDQGSYLINVVEGPEYYGDFAGMNSGIYKKRTEDISSTGIIIQDLGNHMDFKVRVEGIGDVRAVNGYPGVLDVKDKVSVTLYNNPVED